MPNNTDSPAQRRRKRDAVQSVLVSGGMLTASAVLMLYLRAAYVPEGFGSFLLLALAIVDLGMLIPILILLKKRMKEIQGGEEDAASQY